MADLEGQPARNGNGNKLTVAVDIKSILFVITVMAPLLGMSQWIMSVRQDVRSNTLRIIDVDQREKSHYEELHAGVEAFKRAQLLYCRGLKRDSLSAPDADC
jgi:hypothetical protein